MPTPMELTMAKMLVANLASDRREGLIDLLCEEDPQKVVDLLQIQQDRLQAAAFIDAINDIEYITEQSIRRGTLPRSIDIGTGQAAKRVRFSSSSDDVQIPTTQVTKLAALATSLDSFMDGEKGDLSKKGKDNILDQSVDGGSDYKILGDDDNLNMEVVSDTSDLTDEDKDDLIHPSERPKMSKTALYNDFNSRHKGRADRLNAHEVRYSKMGRGEVKKHFAEWVCRKDKAKVASGEITTKDSFSTVGSVTGFFDDRGYGCRVRYPILGRWHQRVYPGLPNAFPKPDDKTPGIELKTAAAPVKNDERARAVSPSTSKPVPQRPKIESKR